MSRSIAGNARHATARFQSEGSLGWTESTLRRAVEQLHRELHPEGTGYCCRVAMDEIVQLGLRPDILHALKERLDPKEAVLDVATRHAFEALILQGRPCYKLPALSQTLIRRTLNLIYQRSEDLISLFGEDPLVEDPGLLDSICKSLARYVPHKPMGAHISWKLRHYEGAVSRAMRQIQNLVCNPEVTETFVAHVLEAQVPDILKAELLQLARGGGRKGVNYEAVVRFFALPATVAFVKRFASTVQTARTLYDEEEYQDISWQGKRRLPAERRQGYLEAALARFEQRYEVSLDSADVTFHDLLEGAMIIT